MATLNEVKEQMIVIGSVGDFTNALQQIATIRMIKLRAKVLESRPFVEAATDMMRELLGLRANLDIDTLIKLEQKHKGQNAQPATAKSAVIVITSNAGLIGRYNIEIYQKIEKILEDEKGSDFFVIGKKGQEVFANGKFKVQSYPYEVGDNFSITDLTRLTNLFDYYSRIVLVYSRFINTATRDVVAVSVVTPSFRLEELDEGKNEGKFMFEPDIIDLIEGVSKKLRTALFQQQIFDSRLSQNSAQMIGMKTASDNAVHLLADLRVDYNKQRRKLIDKKISEVFAGSALW